MKKIILSVLFVGSLMANDAYAFRAGISGTHGHVSHHHYQYGGNYLPIEVFSKVYYGLVGRRHITRVTPTSDGYIVEYWRGYFKKDGYAYITPEQYNRWYTTQYPINLQQINASNDGYFNYNHD